MILVTPSSQATNLDTQWKLACGVFRMRYTYCCLRVCRWPWFSLTCQSLSTPSTITNSLLSVNKVWLHWNRHKMVYNISPGPLSISQNWISYLCFKSNFRVPHCSVLGPSLFSIYTTPFSQVIAKYMDVKYHYADDS